jgi:hypothetical protein
MTTPTLPTQTPSAPTLAPVTAVAGPSHDDAAALVQLVHLHAQLQVSDGLDVVWRPDFPQDPYTIDAWYPPGTDGRRGLESVLVWFQTVGTLVKHGLLDPAIARDVARADLVWARIGPMAVAERGHTGDDEMWGGFQLLAKLHATETAAADRAAGAIDLEAAGPGD